MPSDPPRPIPTTCIIPPTPNPPQSSTRPSKSPPGASRHHSALGRLSEENRKRLVVGFDEIEIVLQRLTNDTGLPISQILTLWDKVNGRETRSGNCWNIYEGYLKDPVNQGEEIRRAGLTYRM